MEPVYQAFAILEYVIRILYNPVGREPSVGMPEAHGTPSKNGANPELFSDLSLNIDAVCCLV